MRKYMRQNEVKLVRGVQRNETREERGEERGRVEGTRGRRIGAEICALSNITKVAGFNQSE